MPTRVSRRTELDEEVARLLEKRFKAPVVYLARVWVPKKQDDSIYWVCLVRGQQGAIFVRSNGRGEYLSHGPSVDGIMS